MIYRENLLLTVYMQIQQVSGKCKNQGISNLFIAHTELPLGLY